jgi:peptide deformylase
MAIRDIVLMGDPVLRTTADEVSDFDDELRTLVRDMFESMYRAEGIGLAAPQVGILKRVLVVDLRREEEPEARVAVVNPVVTWASGELDKAAEGCLSIPGIEDVVVRPWAVKIEGYDPKGRPVSLEAEELFSRVLQHEVDHLEGVLFLDRLSPLKRRMQMKKWKKLREDEES